MASLSTIYSESSESVLHPPGQATQPIIIGSAPPQQQPDPPRPTHRPYGPFVARYPHPRQSVYGYTGSTSRFSSYEQPAVVTAQSLYGSRPASRNSNQDPWLPIDPYSSGSRPHVAHIPQSQIYAGHAPDTDSSLPTALSSVQSSASSVLLSSEPSSSSSSSGHLPLPVTVVCPPKQRPKFSLRIPLTFLDLILGKLYLSILLWMPSHYFNRITRVFLEAELSVPDVKDMSNAVEDVGLDAWYVYPEGGGLAPPVSPALSKFRILWEDFIDSMKSDWKSANIVTVLLLGALLTMLQIEGIEGDPVARTGVLLSLVCALMSLLYGSIYMARFGMMNRLYKAAAWASEARKVRTPLWWNVWIFLALPAIWLAWSVIFFTASILSYVWRTGSTHDPEDPVRLAPLHELGPRIGISFLFVLGLLYLVLVLRTLRRFGSSMDDEWRAKTNAWRTQKVYELPDAGTISHGDPLLMPPFATPIAPVPVVSPVTQVDAAPTTIHAPVPPIPSQRAGDQLCTVPGPYRTAVKDPAWRPRSFNQLPYMSHTEPFAPFEFLDLSTQSMNVLTPNIHYSFHVATSNWKEFTEHVKSAWFGMLYIPNMSTEACTEVRHLVLQDLVDTWNAAYFLSRHLKVTFSLPEELDGGDDTPAYEVPQICFGINDPPTPTPTLYLSYVKAKFDTSKSRFFPFLSPSQVASFWMSSTPEWMDLQNPQASSDSVNVQDPNEFTHPSTAHPLDYQDAPGPYRKALEVTGSFPSIFYRNPYTWYDQNSRIVSELRKYNLGAENSVKAMGVANLDSEAWERLTVDLRRVLADKFPIPNVPPDLWASHRSLLVADLLETWNIKYFLRRGIELVLDANSSTTSDFGIQSPYKIHLDPIMHGLDEMADNGFLSSADVLPAENKPVADEGASSSSMHGRDVIMRGLTVCSSIGT